MQLSAANLVTSGRQANMLTHRPLGVRAAARQPLLPSSRRGGTLPRKLETVVSATGPPGLNVSGPVYTPDDRDYASKRNQYAYSSYADEGGMNPAAIIYAKDDVDVKRVIEYAAERKLAIAVRTGGHQYSGASSTALGNIQLDLSDTYKDFGYDDSTNIVTTGISYRLSELNSKLGELGVFVPHGQCAYVNVGGHAHTGGYGLPGRAFGLFGDHIVAVRVFTADGNVRWIERNSTEPADADLFWAILGGSPGNFAILTHIKLKVHRDVDHPKACGMSLYAPYSKAALTRLLQIKAEMADDVNLPADYDMCITVMSADKPVQGSLRTSAPILMALNDDDGGERLGSEPEERPDITTVLEKYGVPQEDIEALKQQMPKPKRSVPPEDTVELMAFGGDMKKIDVPDGAAVIIVWAEWANLGGAKQDYDPSWFQRIKGAANFLPFVSQEFTNAKMSFLTSKWVFPIQREFDGPYNKRTYATSSTSLTKSGWVSFTADQIHSIVSPSQWIKGARVAVQIQNYGGDLSTYRLNDPTNKTSYSWRRDTTVVLTMDCFYVKDIFGGLIGKEIADAWVTSNDAGLKGPDGKFSPNEDRRLLWGSYHATIGEKNLYNARLFYHETEEKWARLAAIKRCVDPHNILSPNEFAVKA